jgi:small-conductance mechanosensitive channel
MGPNSPITARIFELLQWPMVIVVLSLGAIAWLIHLGLRSRWNPTRRKLMVARFTRLLTSAGIGFVLFTLGGLAQHFEVSEWLTGPLGFVTLIVWMVVALRVARVLVLLWLFANSAREGVPLLLVDLFSVGATMVALAALVHRVFLIEVTSLLATSAVVSVVLGLALQDTLGNLFSGISIQIDRPFRLGDWIEVRSGSDKVSGQVMELTWRSTVLMAIGEELITIPNRTVAQGLVLNYSGRERPFVRVYIFRVPLESNVETARAALLDAARLTPGVLAEPPPSAFVAETTESWVALKLIIFINDFGTQFTIADQVQTRVLSIFAERGLALATARVKLDGAK